MSTSPFFQRTRSALTLSTLLVVFIFFYITFVQKHISDGDFWWHLATGKYIVTTMSLPQSDPFSYPPHADPSSGTSILLKGYWLSQVIFYETYRLWDLKGIIFLRASLMILLLLFVFRTIRKQGLPELPSLALVSVVFAISKNNLGDRPQLFTFLFFAMTLYLLEDFRTRKTRKIFLIPFLMLVLANMHGGYVVCIPLISLYLVGEGIRVLRKGTGRDGLRTLLIVWAATLVLSSVNPNGVNVILQMISSQLFTKGTSDIVEYLPPFYSYAIKFRSVNIAYILLLLLSLGALFYLRRIDPTQLLVLGAFTVASLMATRYMMFYACAVAPVVSAILVNAKEEKLLQRAVGFLKPRQDLLNMLVFIGAVFLFFSVIPSLARYEFKEDTSFGAPKYAADFIAPLKLNGNMFNGYAFGGYLIWRLYPDKKVFIDTRGLDGATLEEYRLVAHASDIPGRSWKEIIKKYDISYVIMQPLWPTGSLVALVEQLLDSDEWILIYSDHLTLIFLRDDGRNAPLLERYRLDKRKGMDTIIVQASALAMRNKANPYYLMTLGKLFYRLGKPSDALKAFEMARERDPGNPVIAQWLEKLRADR